MKKLLSILSVCLVFVSYSQNKVLINSLQSNEDSTIFSLKDQPYTGVAIRHYRNGQLKLEITLREGKLNGLSQVWRENGFIWAKTNWKDGNLDGLYQQWDENGQLIEQSNWKDGVQID